MRLAGVVLAFVAASVLVSACASTSHTWPDEFTARLQGAAGSVEEAREELQHEMSFGDYLQIFSGLSRTLEFKASLIEELDPPDGCEEVQEKGEHEVKGLGAASHALPQNLTAELARNLPRILKEQIAKLEKLEHEAETCATD